MIIQQEAEINFNGKKSILTFEIDLKDSHIKNILKKGRTQIRPYARKIRVRVIEPCLECNGVGIVIVKEGSLCMACFEGMRR